MKGFVYLILTLAFLGGLLPGCRKKEVPALDESEKELETVDSITLSTKTGALMVFKKREKDSLGNWSKIRERIVSEELDRIEKGRI